MRNFTGPLWLRSPVPQAINWSYTVLLENFYGWFWTETESLSEFANYFSSILNAFHIGAYATLKQKFFWMNNFLKSSLFFYQGEKSINTVCILFLIDCIENVALKVVSNLYSRYLHGFNYFDDTASILPYGTTCL